MTNMKRTMIESLLRNANVGDVIDGVTEVVRVVDKALLDVRADVYKANHPDPDPAPAGTSVKPSVDQQLALLDTARTRVLHGLADEMHPTSVIASRGEDGTEIYVLPRRELDRYIKDQFAALMADASHDRLL